MGLRVSFFGIKIELFPMESKGTPDRNCTGNPDKPHKTEKEGGEESKRNP
jgi:hypothetical protein